ncbi:16S rRNA (cytidine(1402)-2'-O)-methyltransferase [Francisella orientalis]|uniref:Ribosomal RNA small subunit methyltransferase I n=1 Tax=Francisella orientalis TaxID=299583 RepID=A0AAP6X5F4_9GAMM|nr:16S rRNA (cytidine(1402)-2'-O)-methyltransferase [Francisella orientalis]AFJ42620.1 SAM-dependent methyltransferase [Francisella orientalis str. Toba 04]AHB97779.1 SAM-dependent methyltransferase [Francisella orientalis LADL 07-285A]AKN84871.1 Ribosomal RNA small subunit methyltransferase I [Francisella orientalis FNO12]AKN86409.1 Ribosomal RNA small subunit methyltransferase I [Francisella orientalis FNO24]AKN87947.1 Ribosomal RNA small subunit methyltransferase I [Francisella orientalis]
MNSIEKGILYVVATPIGNLQDITYRAVSILSSADVILAEDTRMTIKLLTNLNIRGDQKLISCHDFNEESRVEYVKELLSNDNSIALVSDAGTPLISDPGYKIVASLRNSGHKVVPVPGVSALITALSAAGLPSDSFLFKGFLSAKQAKRQQQIRDLQLANATVIIYESVHRITYLLDDLLEIMPHNNIVVAKELTKQFEKFVAGSVEEVYDFFKSNPDIIRGEFVVIIDCNNTNDITDQSNLNVDIDDLLKDLLEDMPVKKAVKLVVKLTGAKKNDIYERALAVKKDI